MRTIKTIFILPVVLIGSLSSQSTISADSTLMEIESLYNTAQYVAAELEARRLSETRGITDSVKVQIEKWIAFSLIAQDKSFRAQERFIALFYLHPDFELDPVLTSPKILTVFNDAKVKYITQRKNRADTLKSAAQFTPAPTFRTIVFPGWEQMHQHRTSSGFALMGAGLVTLGTGIACEILRADARDKYLKATIPTDIASKYNSYNNYRKAEIYSFIAFAVVYVASEIDVFTNTELSPLSMSTSQNSSSQNLITFSIRL